MDRSPLSALRLAADLIVSIRGASSSTKSPLSSLSEPPLMDSSSSLPLSSSNSLFRSVSARFLGLRPLRFTATPSLSSVLEIKSQTIHSTFISYDSTIRRCASSAHNIPCTSSVFKHFSSNVSKKVKQGRHPLGSSSVLTCTIRP